MVKIRDSKFEIRSDVISIEIKIEKPRLKSEIFEIRNSNPSCPPWMEGGQANGI
jgi:hypothetical protein